METDGPCQVTCDLDDAASICDAQKSNDLCGVHVNSLIPSHAFWIMMYGKKGVNDRGHHYDVAPLDPNPETARTMASRIAFFTMTQLSKRAKFAEAREVAVQTARWLCENAGAAPFSQPFLGKNCPQVVKTVANAFYAVGVGDKYDGRYYLPFPGDPEVYPDNVKLQWSAFPNETKWEVQLVKGDRNQPPDFSAGKMWTNGKTSKDCAIDPEKTAPDGLPLCTVTFDLENFGDYSWRVRAIETEDEPSEDGKDAATESLGGFKGALINGFRHMKAAVGKLGELKRAYLGGGDAPIGKAEEFEGWGPVQRFTTTSRPPKLKSPTGGKAVSPLQQIFEWEPVEGASGYLVTFADSPDFTDSGSLTKMVDIYDTETKLTHPPMKADDQSHYWEVTPLLSFSDDQIELGVPSEVGVYTLDSEATKALLISPRETHVLAPQQPQAEFKWNPVAGALRYKVLLFENQNMQPGAPIGTPFVTADAVPLYEIPNPAADPKGYCWKVIAVGKNDVEGEWSAPACYRVKPGTPVPIAPLGTIPASKDPLEFQWQAVSGATAYRLKLCNRNPATNQPLCQNKTYPLTETAGTSVAIPDAATYFDGLCWSVTAVFNGLEGDPSAMSCYAMGTGKPYVISPPPGYVMPYDAASDKFWITFEWGGYAPNGYCTFLGDDASPPPVKGAPCPGNQTPFTSTKAPPQEWGELPAGYYMKFWVMTANPNGTVAEVGEPVSFTTATKPPKKEAPKQEPPKTEPPKNCSDLGEAQVTGYWVESTNPWIFHFQWSAVPGAKSYYVSVTQMEWGTNKTISSTMASFKDVALPVPGFVPPHAYQVVNVQAVNECGQMGSIQGKGVGIYSE